MKAVGELGIDLEGLQRQFSEEADLARGGGGEGFLAALLETPLLKESGLSADELATVLEQMADGDFTGGGETLPGNGEGSPKDLLALLAALGSGEDRLDLGGGPAAAGNSDGLATEDGAAVSYQERARLLRALADLQAEGVAPDEMAAALQERLGDVAQEEVVDETIHMAAAGALTLLSALEGGGAVDEVRRNAAMGEQIAREMRAAGALNPLTDSLGSVGGPLGGEVGGGADGETGAERRHPEGLLQAAEGGSRGSTAHGEFTTVLAATGASGAERGAAAVQLTVQPPVGQNGFGNAVGERVVWMVNENVQHARLQLNPPGLGPVEVSVQVGDDRTTITFSAQNAAAREALEAELPRLRQMLAEQGHEHVDVNVSQGEARERDEEGAASADGDGGDDPAENGDHSNAVAAGSGLVDHYA